MTIPATPDVIVINHGTLVTFRPVSDSACVWFEDHVQSEPWQWLGHALGVDHRYADALLAGIEDAGFSID